MNLNETTDPKTVTVADLMPILMRLSTDMAGVKADITDIKADITGLKADMVGVKADIAGLKADMVGVKADMAGVKADLAETKAEIKADIHALREAIDQRVTHEDFHDAFISLSQSLGRTHARLIDNDMRAMSLYRELRVELAEIRTERREDTRRHQELSAVLDEDRDAHRRLERRVSRCEDDLATRRRDRD